MGDRRGRRGRYRLLTPTDRRAILGRFRAGLTPHQPHHPKHRGRRPPTPTDKLPSDCTTARQARYRTAGFMNDPPSGRRTPGSRVPLFRRHGASKQHRRRYSRMGDEPALSLRP
jgi:hypothetical protein